MGTNKVPAEYKNRLLYEIQIITQMNFASYFLIVSDYVVWAKTHGILVGPGRGSAAGSLVSYALRITDIDPIKYDLSFGRFLNKGRSAIPLISFPEYPFEQWMKHRGTHG
jgi:DNA polymerase-3 subunit alpha